MARQATIQGRNGEELHDQEGIRKRWKEYTVQLYAGNNLDEQAEEKSLELELEPDILEDEVVWAIKQLANRKAPGTDDIPLELLKPIPTKTLTSLCQRIWRISFDSIDHDKLWKCLEEMGTPLHLVQLIRSLYQNQEATVRTPYGNTDWFEIGKGTRQGCILSPAAFNMYAEKVMSNAGLEDSSIGRRNINNLRYADDTTLLVESGKDLEDLVLLVKKESEKFGLYLNVKKMKIMSTAATTNISIKIDNEEIEVVDDFIFLGSKINRDEMLSSQDINFSLFESNS
ncbi:Hypothetical predicted protein [Octopus vulgaris]|uniref:Reverse transcriptase domain-containing protein n=1 Tax=Octopus vulgaris TaxID=6645 RepID=A0AA36APF0_OCTVU|nr:Hypothetical predicted protein [Octopus vulgaris]